MPWPKGKKHSDETRRKMRASHLALDPIDREVSLTNLAVGREISKTPENRARTAERMRASMTGRVVSIETRRRASEAATGVPQSAETRSKRSESLKLAHAEGRHPGPPSFILTRSSKLEDAFAKILDALGIEYERQFFAHVPGAGKHPWDFAVPSRRLLIEVDGCYWHGCVDCGFPGVPGRPEKDVEQTLAALAAGWTILRIPEHSITSGAVGLRVVI